MICPHCEIASLEERQRDGVTIHVCCGCRGIWLERAEVRELMARFAREREAYQHLSAQRRPGGVTREEVERALARPVPVCRGPIAHCPGQLPSHYAPAAQVFLAETGQVLSKVEDLQAEFVLSEAERLRRQYPAVLVAPLLYSLGDGALNPIENACG